MTVPVVLTDMAVKVLKLFSQNRIKFPVDQSFPNVDFILIVNIFSILGQLDVHTYTFS